MIAVRAGDRFEQDRRNGFRTLVPDDLLEVVEVIPAEFFLGNIRVGAVEGGAIAVRVEEVDHARHQAPVPRLPGAGRRWQPSLRRSPRDRSGSGPGP